MPLSTPKGWRDDGKDGEHLQSTSKVLSADGISVVGAQARSGAGVQGVLELEPVRLDAVLPIGWRGFAARDLRGPVVLSWEAAASGTARGAEEVHAVLRQRPSTCGDVRGAAHAHPRAVSLARASVIT